MRIVQTGRPGYACIYRSYLLADLVKVVQVGFLIDDLIDDLFTHDLGITDGVEENLDSKVQSRRLSGLGHESRSLKGTGYTLVFVEVLPLVHTGFPGEKDSVVSRGRELEMSKAGVQYFP